jgi:hypothetical protein
MQGITGSVTSNVSVCFLQYILENYAVVEIATSQIKFVVLCNMRVFVPHVLIEFMALENKYNDT